MSSGASELSRYPIYLQSVDTHATYFISILDSELLQNHARIRVTSTHACIRGLSERLIKLSPEQYTELTPLLSGIY